jgi:hypothetical protein
LGRDSLEYAASNVFLHRGIGTGDVVYPVSVFDGRLYLVSRLEVERVCGASEAKERLGYEPFWKALNYLIAMRSSSPMQFDLEVPLEATRTLRFMSGGTQSLPKFTSHRFDRSSVVPTKLSVGRRSILMNTAGAGAVYTKAPWLPEIPSQL